MKLIYPAVFYPNTKYPGYTVELPDLPGCVTCGSDLPNAIAMGIDAASGWLIDEIEDNKPIPIASTITDINLEDGSFIKLLTLNIEVSAKNAAQNLNDFY